MERLPISDRELLIRYGRLAPNARDRVLDQFYLLVPGCASLRIYMFTQGCTFFFGFMSLGLFGLAIYLMLNTVFHWTPADTALFISTNIVLFEIAFVVYVLRRRVKLRKRYHEKFMQPTEIGLSEGRINLHHRIIHGGSLIRSIRWDEMSFVDLVENTGKEGGTLIRMIDHDGRTLDLQLEYIQTIEERQILREFIQRQVKHMDVRPIIDSILRIGKPDDVPFTKLWCQALQDSRPRVHTAPLTVDTTLQNGRFTITDCIGGGGQGTVYSAEMRDLEGVYNIVLKEYVLPDIEHAAEHKAACEQFEKEIRLLGLVRHDGIIKLLDAFVEDHRAYLVLDHVRGLSLKDHVEKHGALTEEAVIRLAMQMCDILDHLHSMQPKIMHLDFSPENILLSSDGRIVLIDFNISVQENAVRTRTVMGKQRYMAPEQYRGTPSPLSDIYSLGATLYYLLTAREPEPISTARAGKHVKLNAALDQIIACCTALEEEDRFQSANELKAKLEPLCISVETTDGGDGVVEPVSITSSREEAAS